MVQSALICPTDASLYKTILLHHKQCAVHTTDLGGIGLMPST